MTKPVEQELSELERAGRVSIHGQRPVHASFGFTELGASESAAPETEKSSPKDLAGNLDDAWSRLKQRAPVA